MKKTFVLLALVAMCHMTTAQNQAYLSEDFVWCGIDFSKAKLLGREGFTDLDKIKDYYFDNWNQLMLDEPEKYDFADHYDKGTQYDNLSVVKERNLMPKVDELVIEESYDLDEGQIQQIVSAYKGIDDRSDVGLLYVVESFSKVDENAKITVVFFDINSGSIEWMQEYNEKPGGFGFRNFWAGAMYKILKDSGKDFSKAAKKAR